MSRVAMGADRGVNGQIRSADRSSDWGDVDRADAAANDEALQLGERMLSAYRLPGGATICIITEADRSATTILLPSEY